MAMRTKEHRTQIAEQFVQVLEEKELDWKKEWKDIQAPLNGKSNHSYRGLNRFYLTMIAMRRGYEDPRWCTFNQIKNEGWSLENAKGQGVKVEYWFPYDKEEKKSLTWSEFREMHVPLGERYVLWAKYATVFNADLIRGIAPLPKPEAKEIVPVELVQTLSKNMEVPIFHDGEGRAFYRPEEDAIHLPEPDAFFSEYAYNSTALHELAHATGAVHRLNRNYGSFGTTEYAFEELVAEITSCFLSAELQIQTENHIENHKAYVQSWIQKIKEKPEALILAIQQAEQTTSYMEYKAELITKEEYEMEEKGSFEAKDEQINKEPARKNATIGKAVQRLREENHMERDTFAGMALLSLAELEKIESGEQKPDQDTLELIGNFFRVYPSELEQGRIMEMKNYEDILAVMNEVSEMLKEVKDDTDYFKNFIQKWELRETPELSGHTDLTEVYRYQALEEDRTKPDTKYVILDTETGELMSEQYENERLAQNEAEWLNWKAQYPDIKIPKEKYQQVRAYEHSAGLKESRLHQISEEKMDEYIASTEHYLQFGKQVDDYLSGNLDQRNAIYVCDTPAILQDTGCQPLPMYITQRHLQHCMHPEEPGHPEYHGLTVEQIKRLPEALEAPAMLMESFTKKDSIVAVTPYRDYKNRPIIVSIKREGYASYQLEAVSSNFITSIYGREAFEPFVERVIAENKLLYINTEKSKELALAPVQFRHDHPDLCFDTIIRKIESEVNMIQPANVENPDTKIGIQEIEHMRGALQPKI